MDDVPLPLGSGRSPASTKPEESKLLDYHSAASLFPLLGETALAELADDIRANGLINPIILDRENLILDGRNRYLACLVAGVEPRFEIYEGDDPLGFVVSLNVKRRNLSKQQLAIAAARAWKQAEDEGRTLQSGETARRPSSPKVGEPDLITDARSHFGAMFGVSKNLANMARRVLDYSAELADEVCAGTGKTLEQAYQDATAAERAHKQEAETLTRLRDLAPDLIERIERDELKVAEADAIWRDRDRENREKRRTLYHLLHDCTRTIHPIADAPIAALPELLKSKEYEQEFRDFFKGGADELADRLERLTDAVAALKKLQSEINKGRGKR